VAAEWTPDLILCDAMMPEMDGPEVLARLRKSKALKSVPVVFITARAQPDETERLTALGAAAVIAKPFDPQTLSDTVRAHMISIAVATGRDDLAEQMRFKPVHLPAPAAKLAAASYDFTDRLRADAATLTQFRKQFRDDAQTIHVPESVIACVHKLAGAAGVFNFQAVSAGATELERALIAHTAGPIGPLRNKLDALLACIERALTIHNGEH
jgi:CheY-like chemotaxis protein